MNFKKIVLIKVKDKVTEHVSEKELIEHIKELIDNDILFKVDYRYEKENKNETNYLQKENKELKNLIDMCKEVFEKIIPMESYGHWLTKTGKLAQDALYELKQKKLTMKDTDKIDKVMFIKIDNKHFHCKCGGNLFTYRGDNVYQCNGCNNEYESVDVSSIYK